MNKKFDLLMNKLTYLGYDEIVDALSKGQVLRLSDQQQLILIDVSVCLKFAEQSFNSERVKNALVQVSTSGWGRESETTEPGLIQPLMNL